MAVVAAALVARRTAKKVRPWRNAAIVAVVFFLTVAFMGGAVYIDTEEDDPPPARVAGTSPAVISLADMALVLRLAGQLGIPRTALIAYLTVEQEAQAKTGCAAPWWLLAGIGRIEGGHGTHGGSSIGDDFVVYPPIVGPPTPYGRAMGPMQFIPDSWASMGLDGSGDGVADPNNYLDAVLSAANHLCRSGGGAGSDLSNEQVARQAIFGYNHADWYVDEVWSTAVDYRTQAAALLPVQAAGAGAVSGAGAQRVVAAAMGWVGQAFHPGDLAQCAFFVHEILYETGTDMGVTSQALDGGPAYVGTADGWGPDQGLVVRDPSQLAPGDIVMFGGTYGGFGPNDISHVAIYVGGGDVVGRPTAGGPVKQQPLSDYRYFIAGVRLASYG